MYLDARSTRRRLAAVAACVAAWLVGLGAAQGYIDQNPEQFTLPRLLLEFRSAGLFEVESLDLQEGAVRFKPLELFQGHTPPEGINHLIAFGNRVPPELKDLKVGQKAVLFRDDPWGRAVTMIEGVWYVSSWDRATGWSRIQRIANVFFECGFCGSVPQLAEACRTLLRGEEAVVPCRAKPGAPETQWVVCSLREPHKRAVVPPPAGAPGAAPTPPDAPPAPAPAAPPSAPPGATGGLPASAAPAPASSPPPAAPSPDALPALLANLRADAPQVRMDAAAAIGRLGPRAKGAGGALLAAFPGEKDPFARRAMIAALGQVGPDAREAVPPLLHAVRDGYGSVDDLVGYEATVALARIDPDGAASVALVAAMLQDKDPEIRRRAAGMVRVLGPGLKALTPAVAAAMKDTDGGVRAEAMRSLAALHPEPGVAVPALTDALADPEKFVRLWASNALATYGADAAPAVKALMAAVAKEPDPHTKGQEIRALRYIGPAAAEAVPLLTEALKDPNEMVRSQADRALKRIQPPPPPKPKPKP